MSYFAEFVTSTFVWGCSVDHASGVSNVENFGWLLLIYSSKFRSAFLAMVAAIPAVHKRSRDTGMFLVNAVTTSNLSLFVRYTAVSTADRRCG